MLLCRSCHCTTRSSAGGPYQPTPLRFRYAEVYNGFNCWHLPRACAWLAMDARLAWMHASYVRLTRTNGTYAHYDRINYYDWGGHHARQSTAVVRTQVMTARSHTSYIVHHSSCIIHQASYTIHRPPACLQAREGAIIILVVMGSAAKRASKQHAACPQNPKLVHRIQISNLGLPHGEHRKQAHAQLHVHAQLQLHHHMHPDTVSEIIKLCCHLALLSCLGDVAHSKLGVQKTSSPHVYDACVRRWSNVQLFQPR